MVLSEREKPSLSEPNTRISQVFGKNIYRYNVRFTTLLSRWAIFWIVLFVSFVGFFFAPPSVFGENKSFLDSDYTPHEDASLRSAMTYNPEFLRKEMQMTVFTLESDKEESDPEHIRELREYLEKQLVGYPMERMIPELLTRDVSVVAFLVGIAKKESNWGKRVPLDENGEDCFNYWGYRASGSLGTQRLGYGCFATPEEAIDTVGSRIETLAIDYKRNTPDKMIVWKCGSSCAGHDPLSVSKWISDVSLYYGKILALAQ